MNKQLSALPDNKTIRILLPYNRQYVIFAVYDCDEYSNQDSENAKTSLLSSRSAFIFSYKSPTLHNFLCIMET